MNNFTDYYKQQTEKDALIKRKTNELQAKRKSSSNASSANSSPVASSQKTSPPASDLKTSSTAIASTSGSMSATTEWQTPAKTPVKAGDQHRHVGIALNTDAEAEEAVETQPMLRQSAAFAKKHPEVKTESF